MRIGLAQIIQESNTFVPFKTTLDHFSAQYIRQGEAVVRELDSVKIELTGMLNVLETNNATPIPLIATHGSCGGPLTRECFGTLLELLVKEIKSAHRLDGLLLALHGSMAAEDQEDCESEILNTVRQLLPEETPIGVSLDLHAHITSQMLQKNVFFVGYESYPHVDMFTTGQKTAQILIDTILGKIKPVMALSKKPMIISPVSGRTTEGPMTEVVAEARRMEKDKEFLAASYFMVQPWLDFKSLGFATLVCADDNTTNAQVHADKLSDIAWGLRDSLLPSLDNLDDAIIKGLSTPGTTVVADCGDATSGGAAGDSITVLKTLLRLNADKNPGLTYITLVDAPAASLAAKLGIGSKIETKLGHSLSHNDGTPLEIEAIVKTITNGIFKMSAGLEGAEMNFGLTAVLEIGSIRIAVRSISGLEWDTGQFTSVGLGLTQAKLVFVKSPSHFRATFGPYATQILTADTPGPTRVNIAKVNYEKLQRPIHPLDKI